MSITLLAPLCGIFIEMMQPSKLNHGICFYDRYDSPSPPPSATYQLVIAFLHNPPICLAARLLASLMNDKVMLPTPLKFTTPQSTTYLFAIGSAQVNAAALKLLLIYKGIMCIILCSSPPTPLENPHCSDAPSSMSVKSNVHHGCSCYVAHCKASGGFDTIESKRVLIE